MQPLANSVQSEWKTSHKILYTDKMQHKNLGMCSNTFLPTVSSHNALC